MTARLFVDLKQTRREIMLSPRWRKVAGDLQATRGRIAMIALAIAVGIFGVGTILSAYGILTREIKRNYLGTNPAAAQLEVDGLDNTLVEAVRLRPGIEDAEASSAVLCRIEKRPGEWMPALLFVIKDFNAMRINTFRPESGAWPPPEGSILLEREALPLVNAKVGDLRRVQAPGGQKREVLIAGLVHDPGLAPAWQEQTTYGYMSPSTQAVLGEGHVLGILKVTVKNKELNAEAIERTVGELAGWLKQQGHKVGEIRIPPPAKHPHQTQMTAILALLLIFSFLALLLAAVLTATMIGGILAQQVRQIGVMKAIGAGTRQIAVLYLSLVMLIGLVALVLGLPPGIAAGRGFARTVSRLLNFTLYSEAIPWWIYLTQALLGLLTPFLSALVPIINVARTTVREAVNDYGVSRESPEMSRTGRYIGRIRGLDRTFMLALRNVFRRRGRLVLTLGLLAAAGAMFMTGLNVKKAWEHYISDAASDRRYDLEVRLNRPEDEKRIAGLLAGIPRVQRVEIWNMAQAAVRRPEGLHIVRTYPDRGHGSFTMRSVPPGSKMVRSHLISGRWLRPGDTDAVVLNHITLMFYPGIKVGDRIVLDVDGRPVSLNVAGIARQVLTPATAYVSPALFAGIVGRPGQANALRIALEVHDPEAIRAVTREIERILEVKNINVQSVISEKWLVEAQSGHVYIFIFALLFMAGLMAVVGALGLMSAMGTNVTERTREFGVMRTIGASSGTVMRGVIFEGVFIGLQSWVIAVILSLPLSLAVGRLLGNLAFRWPLPLFLSLPAILIWLTVIVLGSIAASAYPAWKASRLTIRETLACI